jgi:hypothetical protein
MGWLRDRLARLGVRSPAGRDAVATALAVPGLARAVVTLVVSGGRLPVPAWQLAAADLASTADFGTIALRRRAPRTALALATAVVVAAAALPVRYAMTGLGVGLRPARRRLRPAGWPVGPRAGRDARAGPADRRHPHRRAHRAGRLAGRGPAARPTAPGRVGVSIRLVLADDQAVVRAGFRTIVEAEADITVVGQAGDGEAAIAEARRLRPDLVLMDVRMPGTDGIAATGRLAGPGVRDRVQAVVYAYEHGVVTPGEDGRGADRGEEGRR